MKDLSLVYVNPIGKDSSDMYEYEFFFSETPDVVWGEKWHIQCPSACGDMKPDEETYSVIKRLRTEKKLFCAQENSCFSMQDAIDHIIALCFEDINGLPEYPEHRFVVPFGEKYEDVVDQLHIIDLEFEEGNYMTHQNSKSNADEEDPDYEQDDDKEDDDDFDETYPLNLNF